MKRRAASLVALVLVLGAASVGRAADYSRTRLADVSLILQRLCEVQALSSHEAPLTRRIQSLLPKGMASRVDEKGNLIVDLGQGPPLVTFIAHQDEIGYEVKAVEVDGRVRLTRKGGFYEYLYEAHPVVIGTSSGPVQAVVAPRPGYQDPKSVQDGLATEDIRLDVGTDSWAATGALGVRAGDPVTVAKRYARMGPTAASARSMDDRVGCAALLLSLQELDVRKLAHRVRFIFSTEEELGLFGAEFVARAEPGEVCFAIDTFVSSDSPLESPRFAHAPLGEGCVIRAIDSSVITSRDQVERVRRLAQENHLDLQYGLTGGGNDGARFVTEGAVDIPLGWPLRYSHSAAETVDLRDVASLADLVSLLARKF